MKAIQIWALAVLVALATVSAAQAADITWNVRYSATKTGDNKATVSGAFNLQAVPSGITGIQKIQFYKNGVLYRTESASPYWLYGDNAGTPYTGTIYPLPSTIEARVIVNGVVAYKESFTLSAPTTTTASSPSPPPPAPSPPPSTSNLLTNGNLISSLTKWEWLGGNGFSSLLGNRYVAWWGTGKNDAGSIHISPNWGGSTEAWERRYSINPGDKVIYEGWFKAGARGKDMHNDGVGLGFDIRKAGDSSGKIIYTMNGPATINQAWTYIYAEHIIPCKGHPDQPIEKWSVSSGVSGTNDGGARGGLWSDAMYLNNQPMPTDLLVTPWVHIWHESTVLSGDIDNLQFRIVKDALNC